jgi:DNA-binding NtrC family response regulator
MVEIDEAFRWHLAERLRLRNYTVLEAVDEESAKQQIKKRDIDVVLLGLEGTGQRGLSLLRAIKTMRPLSEVILINQSDELALSMEGMKLGAFDDLWVPFDLETLLERIDEACRRKREKQFPSTSGGAGSPLS